MSKMRGKNVHNSINQCNNQIEDNTNKRIAKRIDSLIISLGIIECIMGSKIIDFNKSIKIDYREFIIDLKSEQYFRISLEYIENIDN